MKSAALFLNIPPQEALPGLPFEAQSILHLVHFKRGGCQRTSLRIGTFGWCMEIRNSFKNEKSLIEFDDTFLVLLPVK
jgi:hypothetical protein